MKEKSKYPLEIETAYLRLTVAAYLRRLTAVTVASLTLNTGAVAALVWFFSR